MEVKNEINLEIAYQLKRIADYLETQNEVD